MSQEGDKVPDSINSLRRNWLVLTTAVVLILSYGEMRMQVNDNAHRLATFMAYVDDLRLHGFDGHERRITAIEAQKADQLGIAIQNLTRSVSELTTAQKSDHDMLVRLATLREKESKTQ